MTQYVVNQLLLVTAPLSFILKRLNCMQFLIFVLKYLAYGQHLRKVLRRKQILQTTRNISANNETKILLYFSNNMV